MNGARVALGFLTRVPVADREPLTASRLSAAAPWFPVVGLLVGGLVGGTRLLFDLFLPAGPATVLAIAAGTGVTVAVALVAAGPGAGAVALGVAALVTAAAGGGMARALGGATGDVYGAVVKLVELGAIAGLVAMWGG
jgi:cobalamin synthase